MKPKRTILCVDDDEAALSIRKLMLETRGYRVLPCTSGEAALRAFQESGADLLLSDVMMPGMQGTDLVARVKELSPQTPAILISGRVKVYQADTQADLFLAKGMYGPAELLEHIRTLLVRRRTPRRVPAAAPTARSVA